MDEKVESKMILRSQLIEVPLQGLFFSVLNYKSIQQKYLPDESFKLENFEFVHLDHIKGTTKLTTPSIFDINFQNENED